MDTIDQFVSIPEAAKAVGVTRATMWNWVTSGHITAFVTPGGHHRILRADLDAFMTLNRSVAANASKKATILIVDDEPQVRKALQAQLTRRKYQVETAADGFSAGMMILKTRPDLVLLDLFMAGLDGFAVCRRIKQDPELRHIKVLALTGRDTPDNRSRILKEGADDYLSKATDFKTLFAHIDRLLNHPKEEA